MTGSVRSNREWRSPAPRHKIEGNNRRPSEIDHSREGDRPDNHQRLQAPRENAGETQQRRANAHVEWAIHRIEMHKAVPVANHGHQRRDQQERTPTVAVPDASNAGFFCVSGFGTCFLSA